MPTRTGACSQYGAGACPIEKLSKTIFDYLVNGKKQTALVNTPSVFAYNNAVRRLLAIADKNSVRASSV